MPRIRKVRPWEIVQNIRWLARLVAKIHHSGAAHSALEAPAASSGEWCDGQSPRGPTTGECPRTPTLRSPRVPVRTAGDWSRTTASPATRAGACSRQSGADDRVARRARPAYAWNWKMTAGRARSGRTPCLPERRRPDRKRIRAHQFVPGGSKPLSRRLRPAQSRYVFDRSTLSERCAPPAAAYTVKLPVYANRFRKRCPAAMSRTSPRVFRWLRNNPVSRYESRLTRKRGCPR